MNQEVAPVESLEDLDFDIMCEVTPDRPGLHTGHDPEPHPAEWEAGKTCGCAGFFCSQRVMSIATNPLGGRCGQCGAREIRFVYIEPIRRKE
jgi:hypothetical protein